MLKLVRSIERPDCFLRQGRTRVGLISLGVGLLVGGLLGTSGNAHAAVKGHRGRGWVIEGPRDRRGFYVGGGIGFGGTFVADGSVALSPRVELDIGGGLHERLTLGASLHLDPYVRRSVRVGGGCDIELTGYIVRGFYLRGAGGGMLVPESFSFDQTEGVAMSIGGAAGLGYEFWLNATAAMSAGVTYDARFVPSEDQHRHGVLLGFRFTWF